MLSTTFILPAPPARPQARTCPSQQAGGLAGQRAASLVQHAMARPVPLAALTQHPSLHSALTAARFAEQTQLSEYHLTEWVETATHRDPYEPAEPLHGGQAQTVQPRDHQQPSTSTARHRPSQAGARALTRSISSCRDWYDIRAVLAQHSGSQVNALHVTAALNRTASQCHRYSASAAERAQLAEWLDGTLLPLAYHRLPQMRAREISTVLHALATLRHAPAGLHLVCSRVHDLLPTFSGRDVATCAWALSQLAQLHAAQRPTDTTTPLVLDTIWQLLQASLHHLDTATEQDLSNIALAAARVCQISSTAGYTAGHTDTGGYSSAGSNGNGTHYVAWDTGGTAGWGAWRQRFAVGSLPRLHACGPQALANLAHGLSQVHSSAPLPTAWHDAFQAAVMAHMPSATPQALTTVLSALSGLGYAPGCELAGRLLRAVRGVLHECSLEDMCALGQCAPLHLGQHTAAHIQGSVPDTASQATHHSLSGTADGSPAESDGSMSESHAWWMAYQDAVGHRLTGSAQPRQLSLLLLSLAKGCVSLTLPPLRPVLTHWFHVALPKAPLFTPLDVSQALTACVVLGVAPPQVFMDQCFAAVRQALPAAPRAHVASCVWAAGRLRYKPNWQFMLALYSSMTPLDTSVTALAPLATVSADSHSSLVVTSTHGAGFGGGGSIMVRGRGRQLTLRDAVHLVGGLAHMGQRPMAAWTAWLRAALPATLAQAAARLQRGPDAAGTASVAAGVATLVWGLQRIHVTPDAALRGQVLYVAHCALPHVSTTHALLLLWSVTRLVGPHTSTSTQPSSQATNSAKSTHTAVTPSPQLGGELPSTALLSAHAASTQSAATEAVQTPVHGPAHVNGHTVSTASDTHEVMHFKGVRVGMAAQGGWDGHVSVGGPVQHTRRRTGAQLATQGYAPGTGWGGDSGVNVDGLYALFERVLAQTSPLLCTAPPRTLLMALQAVAAAARAQQPDMPPRLHAALGAWLRSWLVAHTAHVAAAGAAGRGAGAWRGTEVSALASLVHLVHHNNQPSGPHTQADALASALATWLDTVCAAGMLDRVQCAQLPKLMYLADVTQQHTLIAPVVDRALQRAQAVWHARKQQHAEATAGPRKRGRMAKGAGVALSASVPSSEDLRPVVVMQLTAALLRRCANTQEARGVGKGDDMSAASRQYEALVDQHRGWLGEALGRALGQELLPKHRHMCQTLIDMLG